MTRRASEKPLSSCLQVGTHTEQTGLLAARCRPHPASLRVDAWPCRAISRAEAVAGYSRRSHHGRTQTARPGVPQSGAGRHATLSDTRHLLPVILRRTSPSRPHWLPNTSMPLLCRPFLANLRCSGALSSANRPEAEVHQAPAVGETCCCTQQRTRWHCCSPAYTCRAVWCTCWGECTGAQPDKCAPARPRADAEMACIVRCVSVLSAR